MRILADENIELEIINALRNARFEVTSVRETSIGAADDEILQIVVAERAVILTHRGYDKDGWKT